MVDCALPFGGDDPVPVPHLDPVTSNQGKALTIEIELSSSCTMSMDDDRCDHIQPAFSPLLCLSGQAPRHLGMGCVLRRACCCCASFVGHTS